MPGGSPLDHAWSLTHWPCLEGHPLTMPGGSPLEHAWRVTPWPCLEGHPLTMSGGSPLDHVWRVTPWPCLEGHPLTMPAGSPLDHAWRVTHWPRLPRLVYIHQCVRELGLFCGQTDRQTHTQTDTHRHTGDYNIPLHSRGPWQWLYCYREGVLKATVRLEHYIQV